MVQLKSFKLLEAGASSSASSSAGSFHEASAGGAVAEPAAVRSSSTLSATSSDISTVPKINSSLLIGGGGNLTSDSSSQNSASNECQLAQVDLGEEEGDVDENNQAALSQSAEKQSQTNETPQEVNHVTKIVIEHPGVRKPEPLKLVASQQHEVLPLNQRQMRTPLTPRLRLAAGLQQSQASSTPLGSRQLARTSLPASPLVTGGTGGKRAPSPADSASQHSYAMQQRNNQFEIRWHNVRLEARPKSFLPALLTENPIYRRFFGGATVADVDSDPAVPCYSPPMLHKIPPTIEEELGPQMSSISSPPLQQQQGFRCILNNVSGQVFSGQMTAILGPSGVGKTTLLNSLTGRNTLDGSGRVSLIGANDSKRMSVVTVPQMDVLPGKLSTLEDLEFTSRLKNPQSRFDHARNIERVVKCLHMEKFLHTRIDKLSGGEARRLSIGRELLNSPDIMILDEPTSGLDANTCKKIITSLRDIVEHSDNILDKPMSIIITIHQPQQEVYNIFHRIYVMAQGGRVIYEGSPELLLPTFVEQSSLNCVCPVEQLNENPAIVAIEVASGEYGPRLIDELANYHENQVYEEFVLYNNNSAPIGSTESPFNTPRSLRHPHKSPLSVSHFDMSLHRKRLNSIDSSIGRPTPILAKRQLAAAGQIERISSMTSLSYASTYDADLPDPTSKLKVDKRLRRSVVMKSNFWSHTVTLIRRCWLLTKRDMFLMAIRILGFLLVAAGTVQIFSHALDPEEHQCPHFESEVDDMWTYMGQLRARLLGLLDILRQGNSTHLFFFHLLLCITMVTSALTGLVFPLQMRMFIREYKNGWYSPASFIMSQTIAELPADIIGPILTLLITYPLCHQPDSLYHWRQFGYAVVLVACCIICKSQAQIVGAFLMDSVENSVFISCVCVTGPALLSGIPVRIDQMVSPMQWISYASFLRYAFESLLALRYGYGMCPCDPELVNGYPIVASARAIPPHLENLAVGLLALNQPDTNLNANLTSDLTETDLASASTTVASLMAGGERENLFLRFIRLITDAGNMFIGGSDLGDCKNYRSLYLIGMNIPKDILNNWIPVMLLMFVVSRFLTYFAVKTVIKLRRN